LVAAEAESDFLVEAVVTARFARVEFTEVGFSDAEEASAAYDFFDDGQLDHGSGGFDMDGVDEIETVIFVVHLDVIFGRFEVEHFLVWFPGVIGGDKYERDLELFGGATGVGCEDAKSAAAADTVVLVVEFHGPVDVGAVFGEFVGEIGAINSRVKFVGVFDVV